MKITATRVNGAVDVEIEAADGSIQNVLRLARQHARAIGRPVHFTYGKTPMSVVRDSNLAHIYDWFKYQVQERQTDRRIIAEPNPGTVPTLDSETGLMRIPRTVKV